MKIPNGRFAVLNLGWTRGFGGRFAVLVGVALLSASGIVLGQTVGTGSIVGVVSDPQGKVLAGTKVEIRNKGKAVRFEVMTSPSGMYSSGPMQPGNYVVRVGGRGFKTETMTIVVQVGNVANANLRMQVGLESEVVDVPYTTAVNVDQATIQGVINGELIERLPVSGRNFGDLAQLEPGVQVQDSSLFAAGQNGLSSVSFLGGYGRTTRVQVDGIEISDETAGATTQNIPASAIREFQVAQSLLDLSTGLTAFGAVNVTTRSGGGIAPVHGEVFGVFRGDQGAAALPDPGSSFQREFYGGNAGGVIIKDKVFWFADAERAQQNLTTVEPFTYPFNGLGATLVEPYREFNTDERVDWNMRGSTRAFYRLGFFQNSDLRPYGAAGSTQQMRSDNNTLTNGLGFDFSTGVYMHSLRFEYLKLRSDVDDATGSLSGIDNPIPGLGINIGASTAGNCILSSGGGYCGGPSWLAPQQTVQSDKLARYDGSWMMGKHIIRYGIAFNHIEGGRLASISAFPQVGTTSLNGSTSPDPTSYAADWVSLGNGIGFATTKSAFGFPGGGLTDNRFEFYVGDGWKVRPRVTLNYGVSYVHDTGRTDSGLGPLPALNQWGPGLGNAVRDPKVNFAPQAGFAWDAGGNGKTVIRGGGGLVYDNALWNNTLLDSPSRLTRGIFASAPTICQGGVAGPFAWPTSLAGVSSIAGGAATVVSTQTGLQAEPTFCGQTISSAAPEILALNSAFQAAAASVPRSQPNVNFVGSTLSALNPNYDLFFPGYRTPRSWEMNLGLQKEIRPGAVLSVDYVHNIGQHFLIGQDVNHSGAARSFNQANAVAARDAAQIANGCAPGLGQATCMINSTVASGGTTRLGVAGAQAAYSAAGLDSNLQTAGGGPCSYCAFPGVNPIAGNTGAAGGLDILYPDGRSVYSGLQTKLVERIEKPVRFVNVATFELSHVLSKFTSQALDQSSVNLATDNDFPTRFTGPNALDRKHQITFGGTFDLPFFTKISMISHFYSPLPQTLELPELTNGGEIFASDWLGTGLGAGGNPEPLPGTTIGQFQRATQIWGLQNVISTYNHNYGGTLTPAGNCLVGNNIQCPGLISGSPVMTSADMTSLGWVMPTLGSVAPNATGAPWVKTLDLKASWPLKVREWLTIEPSASIFNVFNFANEFLPGNLPSSSLIPGQNGLLAPNAAGGVAPGSSLAAFRASYQSGTFAMGSPRAFEFGLRIGF